MKTVSLAVVIPMFNEEAAAGNCVRQVCDVLRLLPNRCLLIVVNDGSRDQTAEVLRREESEAKHPLLVVTHERNSGYGAALRTGILSAAQAGLDYVLFMDSDLTNSPQDIPRFLPKMAEGIDVIKATRYSGGGAMAGVPKYRVLISTAGNIVARALFRLPLHDCTNGFRCCKTSLLVRMRLTENRFPIIMEELYWCKYLAKTFAEIPVLLTARTGDVKKTSFQYKPKVFYDYLKYPVRSFFGVQPEGFKEKSEPAGAA